MKEFLQNLIIGVVVLGVIMLAAITVDEEEQGEIDLYCEMVELRNDDPNLGWPDYKGIYNQECRGK